MTEHHHHHHGLEDLPMAKIERNWKTLLIWLLPVAAALLAGWFFYTQLIASGPTIHIYFQNAAGLQAGKSQVRYRGAQIGEVDDVKLTKDHRSVEVVVTLDSSAENIAREGSQFWIVKPELGAEEIRGLRTIVSGNYVTVIPGEGKKRQTKFQGLAEPPVVTPDGTLRITLFAETIGSLKKRAPVFYRGIQIGEVANTDLGKASQSIRITVNIENHYAPLVRMNSKFWNAGGIHANLSLSGLSISAQSIQTVLSGGIELATPDSAEKPAPAETAFRLYDKPDPAWLSWAPAIPLDDNAAKNSPPATKSGETE